MRALLALFGVLALTALAAAQAAVSEVSLVGPGGLCVAAQSGSHAAPPADATPLVLRACDGSDAQRFSLCAGDCEGEVRLAGREVVLERGRAVLRGRAPVPTAVLRDGALRFWVPIDNAPVPSSRLTGCLTAAMPPVAGAALTIEACDGRAGQSFAAR